MDTENSFTRQEGNTKVVLDPSSLVFPYSSHAHIEYAVQPQPCFTGNFADGKFNGWGCYTYMDGSHYDGEWVDDHQHGHGTFTYTSGNVYTGEFKQGKMTGKGKMTYANGDCYDGEYHDAMMYGDGVFTWASGRTYTGKVAAVITFLSTRFRIGSASCFVRVRFSLTCVSPAVC